MEMNQLVVLSRKYLSGTASEAEKAALLQWYNAYNEEELTAYLLADADETEAALEARMLRRLQETNHIGQRQKIHFLRRRSVQVAAGLLIICTVGGGFWLQNKQAKTSSIARSNVPTLILDDGRELTLDTANKGVLSQQGSTRIVQSLATLSYQQQNSDAGSTVHYNTLRTPRGSQFKLVLPDGTTVWLNAASSIRFPTAFTGNERDVSITGEAYFDVAAVANQPFTVHTGSTAIRVLGTRFNVKAYDDEGQTATTLFQGAVLVNGLQLLPGEQAIITANAPAINKHADIAAAIAWKDGLFSFKDADIATVMRELVRWYDVNVVYPEGIPEGTFTGDLSRQLSIGQLATLMETTRIHMRLTNEGKSIVVTSR